MKTLKLYEQPPQAAIATVAPEGVDRACTRCEWATGLRTVCMNADGSPGGLLVVGDYPTKLDDQVGRPFVNAAAKQVRALVVEHWTGPVAYDVGLRCAPGLATIKPKHIDNCRPYGAQVLREVAPRRIITLGATAAESVLGRRPLVASAKRAYAWLEDQFGDAVPVFLLQSPQMLVRNRFALAAFEADMIWALTCPEPEQHFDGVTMLVENAADAEQAHVAMLDAAWGTYDVETSAKMHNPDFKVEAITVLGDTATTAYTWTREALADPGAREWLVDTLEQTAWVTQNGKYDDRAVSLAFGATVTGCHGDTRLVRKLLEPESKASLDVLAESVGMGGHKEEAGDKIDAIIKELTTQAFPSSGLTPTGKQRKVKVPAFQVSPLVLSQISAGAEPISFAYRYLDDETLYRYNARDVWSTREVWKLLDRQLKASPESSRVWKLLTLNANRAVKRIERTGMPIDAAALRNFIQYIEMNRDQTSVQMQAHSTVNPASPKQLAHYLYTTLGLKASKQTKSGADSTDADSLETLSGKHPYVDLLLTHRKYDTLCKMYGRTLLSHITADGRLHPSLLLDGTASGRLSSQDPNAQNFPRADTAEGKLLRDCFIAAAGWEFVEADESQVEIRVAADLSQDPVLLADFRAGIDIHMNNATECCEVVWKIPRATWDAMTKKERAPYRTQIKTATFGRMYGKTAWGLAKEWGVSVAQVETLLNKIWGKYKVLDRWFKKQITDAQKTGVVWTDWQGKRAKHRALWAIADQDEKKRGHAERQALNTPIQGTAAEYTTASLDLIHQWLDANNLAHLAEIIMTVHDSIIMHCHKSVSEKVARAVRKIMTAHKTNGVVLAVDLKKGSTLGSMVDYELAA